MGKVERLNDAYQYLRSIGKIHTQTDLAKAMNANRVTISNALKDRGGYLNDDFLSRFCRAFDGLFNLDWLLTGTGAMLEKNPSLFSNAEPLSPDHIIYVPLVNQYAYAGYMCGYADTEYIEALPRIPFIVDHEAHGNYMAFEVKGDSMDDGTTDSLIEGDRLLCREIKPEFWIECKLHIRKWDFVIVHKEGILVKRITEHDVQNHTIKIHSLNPLYEDRMIHLKDVRQIFNVIELSRPRRR